MPNEPQCDSHSHSNSADAPKRADILLVEDNTGMQKFVSSILKRRGLDTTLASNAEEALESLRSGEYDLMLLDYLLGSMKASELLQKARREGINVPAFIIMTGFGETRVAVEMMKEGAEDFLSKDSGFASLLPATIDRVLATVMQRRKSEEREELLKLLEASVTSASDGLAVLDLRQTGMPIAHANPAFLELFRLTAEQCALTRFFDLFGEPSNSEPLYRARKAFESGEPFATELRAHRTDGSAFWCSLRLSPILWQGKPIVRHYAVAATDITEKREAAEKLQEAIRNLRTSNRELEEFAYVVSHDLKEPLRVIASYVQLLEMRAGDKLDGSAKEFIQYAVEGAERMQRLIDDLLKYSRVGRFSKPFGPCAMEAVIEKTKKDLQVAIEESGARLEVGPLPTVHGDETQLCQLFQNLIANAIKFRKPGTPPEIKIHADVSRDESGMWRFYVADNGIGFEAEHAERIFVIFQRLVLRDDYPGTGIGLAICKKIIERHNGQISVESEPDRGTTFHFTLPAEAS